MRVAPGWVSVLLVFVAGSGVGGCSRAPAPPAARARPDVLLIVVDTLRADRLGCYGSPLGATPALDALANESLRCARAYSHAPWTLPAFASLHTSQPPQQHGAGGQLGQFRKLAPTARTLAECFRDAGYATAAVLNVDFVGETFGLTQGFAQVDFKTYPDNTQVRDAAPTTDAAIAALRAPRDRPLLLVVHYFDPHLVYAPPAEYRQRFAAPGDPPDAAAFGTRAEVIAYRRGELTLSPEQVRRAERLYNGEVAHTDAQIGRLLAELRAQGRAETTIVTVTADHGEEFLDHGGFEHGHTLYDELVRVPLLFRYPPRLRPGVLEARVGLVDVAPTLCALAGVPPDPHFGGRSLLELVAGTDTTVYPLLLEGNFWGPPLRGWLDGDYKLIVQFDGSKLFNLATDPAEQHDLSAAEPERVQALLADMQLVSRTVAGEARPGPPVEPSAQERERLRSLGYLP